MVVVAAAATTAVITYVTMTASTIDTITVHLLNSNAFDTTHYHYYYQ